MSLKIGGSTSKSNSSTTSQSDRTTTPIVPDWASNLTQSVAGRVGSLVSADPQSWVAPANALQSQAGVGASGLTGSPWNYDGAADLTRGVAASGTPDLASMIPRFQNPYTQDVVNSTLADYDHQAGLTRAQDALKLARSGAFGGSGAALTQAATEGELARGRAAAESSLRSQGFDKAAGLAGAQAGLDQQSQQTKLAAASQLANLSSSYDANQRANIATMGAVGDDLHSIQQQQAQAPATTTSQIVALLSGLPINLFTGTHAHGTDTGSSHSSSSGLNFDASGKIGD